MAEVAVVAASLDVAVVAAACESDDADVAASSTDEATEDADLILILCDHDEFKYLNYNLIAKNMKKAIIFDTKNIINEVPNEIILYNYGNLHELN